MNKRNYKANNKRGLQRLAGALQTICYYLSLFSLLMAIGSVGAVETGNIGFTQGAIQAFVSLGLTIVFFVAGRWFD